MTLAPRLQHYLDTLDADYEVVEHFPTRSAMQNAALCHIPPDRIAKAVLLDTRDDYLLAVVPSDRRVDLADLRSELGAKPRLADENELATIFDDCAVGAVPRSASAMASPRSSTTRSPASRTSFSKAVTMSRSCTWTRRSSPA